MIELFSPGLFIKTQNQKGQLFYTVISYLWFISMSNIAATRYQLVLIYISYNKGIELVEKRREALDSIKANLKQYVYLPLQTSYWRGERRETGVPALYRLLLQNSTWN